MTGAESLSWRLGVTATIQRELRATLFTEWHHLVRHASVGQPDSLRNVCHRSRFATFAPLG